MKKVLLILITGMMGIGVTNAANPNPKNPDEANSNKVTHNKLVRKLGHGISHGYYTLTHNKLTKVLAINHGNEKYKYRDDI